MILTAEEKADIVSDMLTDSLFKCPHCGVSNRDYVLYKDDTDYTTYMGTIENNLTFNFHLHVGNRKPPEIVELICVNCATELPKKYTTLINKFKKIGYLVVS